MCLNQVLNEPVPAEGEGWKVFREDWGNLHGAFYSLGGSAYWNSPIEKPAPVPEGEWLQASKDVVEIAENQFYSTGFHIFLREEDAKAYSSVLHGELTRRFVVRKVKFRGGHTIGLQELGSDPYDGQLKKVIVASEMFIEVE